MDSTTTTVGIIMSATVSVITMSVGLLLFADARYVSSDTFEESKEHTHREFINSRKQVLEDKIFELQLTENPSNLEKAKLERYHRQLEELTKE